MMISKKMFKAFLISLFLINTAHCSMKDIKSAAEKTPTTAASNLAIPKPNDTPLNPLSHSIADHKRELENKRVFHYMHEFEPARVRHLQNMEEMPWGVVVKKYVTAIKAEEDILWNDFFSLTDLTPSGVHDLIEKHEQAYIKADKDNVEALKKKTDYIIPTLFKKNIASMCILFGIDPKTIEALYNPGSPYPYSVSGKTIQANNQGMQVYDPAVKFLDIDFSACNVLGALAHEMWHILYQDRYLEWLAEHVFPHHLKKSTSAAVYKEFCRKFHYFVERRADILGGLQGPFYCDGWANYLTKALEHSRKKGKPIIDEDALHPKHEVRIEYLNKLNDEMARAAAEK